MRVYDKVVKLVDGIKKENSILNYDVNKIKIVAPSNKVLHDAIFLRSSYQKAGFNTAKFSKEFSNLTSDDFKKIIDDSKEKTEEEISEDSQKTAQAMLAFAENQEEIMNRFKKILFAGFAFVYTEEGKEVCIGNGVWENLSVNDTTLLFGEYMSNFLS